MGTTLLSIESAIGGLGRGFASAPFRIGGLTLTGVEVPSELQVGGDQQLVVIKLPGGARIINPLGNDPARRVVSGKFTGPAALGRAQSLEAMRAAGGAYTLSYLGTSEQAIIAGFRYTLADRGAVIDYTLEMEVLPTIASQSAALSNLIGSGAASVLSGITSGIATVATYAENTIGNLSTILGQITPILSIVGAGGPLAMAEDDLTAASGIAGAGINFASAPASLASFVGNTQSAGSSLMAAIGLSGTNITSIAGAGTNGIASDGPSLQAQVANSGALAAAVQAGGTVNASLQTTVGGSPVVHS